MSRLPILLALLAFFVLGAALIARVPIGASPDEAAHWQYVQYLVANHTLPVFKGEVPPAPGYEFHQPPLYYALVAPLWAVLPPGAQNYWARAVSLLCGLATLVFIWKSALLVSPEQREIAALATGLAALWPLHLGVSAGANNDALGGLAAAALFWIGARVLVRGASGRDAIIMGIFVALGALAKNTTLVVSVAALGALALAPRPKPSESAVENAKIAFSPAIRVVVTLAIIAVIAVPWWARNTRLYGDPLALGMFSQAASVSPGAAQFAAGGIDAFKYWSAMLWQIFLTTWGFFGGPNTALAATRPLSASGPIVPESWLSPLMFACLLAPLLSLLSGFRLMLAHTLAREQERVLLFWFVGCALVFVAWLQFAQAHFAGGQARYLHGALLPACVFLALGWRGLWGNGRALWLASAAMALVLLALTLLNLSLWQTLV